MASEYNEIEVHRVVDILNIVDMHGSLRLFRGQSNSKWKLVPRISRLFKKGRIPDTWPRLEGFILDEFQQYAFLNLPKLPRSKFEWMVIGQHYGLPTRLLDWTTNPLKAAYFAVTDYPAKSDGALFALSPTELIPKFEPDEDIDQFQSLMPIYPDMIDPRIVAQEGCFTIFPHAPDRKLFKPLEHSSEHEGSYYKLIKMIVPRDWKQTIRLELNKLGINSRTLFPDLSGLSDFIAWKSVERIY